MPDLVLSEEEQATMRALIACEPVSGAVPSETGVLGHLARLIASDAMGIAVLDVTGSAVGETPLHGHRTSDEDLPWEDEPVVTGIRQRDRLPSPSGSHRSGGGVAVLSLGVRREPNHVVKLWLIRRASDFTPRERALFGIVAPALERELRERPRSALPPSLTLQERRVLHHLATGLTNAEIADRLVVMPSTVRKHLENAYRKLGVSNRLAAVNALEGGRKPTAERPAGAETVA
jgi:DNA-binding CsgD family transcriptional regulator